jgi:flagellar biosynthesis anti-sigma factor FlgM
MVETTRVQNELATDTSATRTERATAAQGLDRAAQAGNARVSSGGSDQIQLSSLTGQIVQLAGAQSTARAARVEELGKMYANGSYAIDPAQLSQRMVNEWLASGMASGPK